ncbi:MAG: DUF1552 domain-containing protein [Verrucomicrobiales bacterium]|nr:DUF1552 domain-containing protein [Verrucomicrobiales bacterium]MED5586770.1 DUF1552 domain-containing protein [Verrucomicrobiota bacterium]
MKTSRRKILKGLSLGAGSTLLSPMTERVMANAEGRQRPPRFVFVIQSNGFDAIQACPESIPFQKYADREKFESLDLTKHKLPKGLAPLEPLKDKTTIIQGLSGRCTGGGHSTHGGCLGLYRTSGANTSPQGITIDYQLGQANPGILPWVGVGMASGAQDALMNISARAAHKSMPIILKPEKAYNAFFSVAAGGEREKNFHLKRNLLDYMVGDIKKTRTALGSLAGEELDAYLSSYDQLAARQYKLLENKGVLKKAAPKLDDRFTSEVATRRLEAQFELATSSLIGGLSNVATITSAATEINAQPYLGIGVDVSNHGYGHMGGNKRDAKGIPYYEKTRGWLFSLIAKMANRLEKTPEGDGNMLDNTLIIYMSDAPDTHHSTGYEWPLAIVGNLKGKMNLGGQYISFPGYGKTGHRTVGALYTTLLNCVGHRQQTFGRLDPDLDEKTMQTGPLAQLMT